MFDLKIAHQFFSLLRANFNTNRDQLNALDSAVGDGDHGFTALRAFQAAEIAALSESSSLSKVFDLAAEAMAENAGGAIGPLLAAFFGEAAVVWTGKDQVGLSEFSDWFYGGMHAVMEVGGAAPGEKTLLDALLPAAEALKNTSGETMFSAVQAAATAAMVGAKATTSMTAVHGRAHFSGDRSRGYQDAGATSAALIVQTLADALSGKFAEPVDASHEEFSIPSGKLINTPESMVREDNEGLALAYPQLVALTPEGILIRATSKDSNKVGLAIGHGGGHTPSMGGLIGPGLLDADVYGPIFTCASGIRIAEAIRAADHGCGVVLLISNHSGDVLNARLALRRAAQEGIRVAPVYLGDDLATAPRTKLSERRGLGGLLFALKTGGAAAEAGLPLEEVVRVMQKTNERTATLSVAVSSPNHPATGQPLFSLPVGYIEVGTGVHGEIGVYRGVAMPADDLVDLLLGRLVVDIQGFKEKKLLVFINGAGGTSRMELHILFRRTYHALLAKGYQIAGSVVDSLFTTQEMGGFSLSLCVVDDELEALWNVPAVAPCFHMPMN
ncbi:MAG: hypothetical protein CVU39_08025 [Chloroflexi bacterium HGW-Chloroflexi-10]|nr:MAG: hypothetical protein CVU39_08025 [Chloroflexi bacterium HGW-Chloroflexi-10]